MVVLTPKSRKLIVFLSVIIKLVCIRLLFNTIQVFSSIIIIEIEIFLNDHRISHYLDIITYLLPTLWNFIL